ncbi:MAG: hypothetical protein P8J37_01730 [Fuerstiella sp.]|nr:hypothetical protein [Fuerstiella sp.]
MKKSRRMTFQLTPLLDLLLIVIFAQYMEVQQKAESAQSEVEQQKAELDKQYNLRWNELERQHAAESGDVTALRERYSAHYENMVKQHQQAGTVLAAAFNLPGRLMEEVLRLKTNGDVTDGRNLENAVKRIEELLPTRGAEMLRFILRYDEMQKHVSVWELHLRDNGQGVFSDGEQSQVLSFGTVEEFVSRAFEVSKAFTEPKPLVIILLTHGDTQAGQRRRAVDGMPLLIEKLRRDAGNTRWFDFSLMGFRPAGPLFNQSSESTE